MEHIIFTASLLGLYLGFDASSQYKIGWWGFAGILSLLVFTLPHLLITVSITEVDEIFLGPEQAERPRGEAEGKVLEALSVVAKALEDATEKITRRYSLARNFFWLIGFPLGISLVVIEWFL